jgi:glycosyltransferase involved in cell wall biosynthesis
MNEFTMTICVPVTKTRYLEKTLASIAAQTSPMTVLVVDNGADGDVEAMIAAVGMDSVRFIKRSQRLPPVENWNAIVDMVTTEWMILLSDDDFIAPDHVAVLSELIARNSQVDVVHSRVRIVNEREEVISYTACAPEWETAMDFLWHRVRGYRIQFLSDFAWRTNALRAAGGFADMPSAWGTDDLTALRLAVRGGIAFSPAATVSYRVHGGSITSGQGLIKKIEAVELLAMHYRKFCAGDHWTSVTSQDAELAKDISGRIDRFRKSQIQDIMVASAWSELLASSLFQFDLARIMWPMVLIRKFKKSF